MAALPALTVLLDDGTGAFPYDITSYARLTEGYTFKRGRQDELSQVTPGDFTLVLDNTDGRFTVGSTVIASPSPIKADQQIRLKVGLVANSTFETDVSGYTGSNATLARSTALVHAGAASMSMTAIAASTMIAVDSGSGVGGIPVAGGGTYVFKAWTRAATTARLTQIRVDWWDAAGVFISTTLGASISDATGSWTALSETFVAPSNAAYARRQLLVVSPAAGEVHYADDFTFEVLRFTQLAGSWPTEWPSGGDEFAVAAISGTDAQAQAEWWPLRSVVEEEPLLDGPVANYTLGEPAGAVSAADSSGNQAPALTMAGSGADVVFGNATGPGTDGLTAATFSDGRYLTLPVTVGNPTVELWFATTTNDASLRILIASGGSLVAYLQNGRLFLDPGGNDLGPVADGTWHHVSFSPAYLDGSIAPGGSGHLTQSPTVTFGGGVVAGHVNFIGSIAHIAMFSTGNSGARILAHYQAGSTGFAGESGTARITRLAGYGSVPVGTLDASLTNVAFKDITGTSAAAAIQDVADAEMGVAYIDGSGKLTFHNRNRPVAKTTPDVTIDANLLAPGTRFEYDMQGVVNYFEVTAQATGIQQLARNATSEVTNKHGRRPQSKTYLVTTDAEALDRANWIVSTHAEPAARVGSLVFDVLTMTATQQQAMLALEPDSWLRVTGLPGQTVGGTTADFTVQGLAEALNTDAWTLTLNAANKAVFFPTPWILDHATYSVLDSTTRIYV